MKNSIKGQALNRADLGKFFGVALTTVDGWIQDGCPYVKKARGKGQQWEFDSAAVSEWLQNRAVINTVGEMADIDLNAAERRKKTAEASIAEIKLRKLQGELVEYSEVEKAGVDSYTACRARLLAIPTKLAPRIILCEKPDEAKVLLEEEIHQAMEELGHYEGIDDDDVSASTDCDLEEGAPAAAETDGERMGGSESEALP